jgi:hypothetical protein
MGYCNVETTEALETVFPAFIQDRVEAARLHYLISQNAEKKK